MASVRGRRASRSEQSGAECVLVEPGAFEGLLEGCEPVSEVADRDAQDTAVVLYTSGTTGTPKGAELTHGNLLSNVEVSIGLFGGADSTVTLGALPFFHSFGQTCALNTTIAVGGRLTLIPRFDGGKALEIIERDGVTLFEGVPTMYTAMLHDERADSTDTSRLEVCVSGGAAMPVEIMRAFEEKFGCAILEGYGLSETSPVASFNRRDQERKPGSIGLPVDGVEMRLVDDEGDETPEGDVGEIVIRGHNVMKGYWRRARRDGRGDRLRRLVQDRRHGPPGRGRLLLHRRPQEGASVIRGGFNIYPREIEEVLYEHPAVRRGSCARRPGRRARRGGRRRGGAQAGRDRRTGRAAGTSSSSVSPPTSTRAASGWSKSYPRAPTGKILKREIKPPEDAAR